ncbi:MAG: penicillin-binding protein 1C, partial [Rhodobacterales bacterium]|nr:penicillin-binding protein 1C [Rhodobacterales bacterium]
VSGGSTLTMQVARLLEGGPTGRLTGKLRQMRVALALERRLDKAQILTLYQQLAPFGGNVEGVAAAARIWFGKDPARLTPAQAALLVAIPQAPESRRPDRHPDRARAARDRVLDRMADLGVIDADTARAARAEAVPTARQPMPQLAPHLTDRLRAQDPAARHLALTLDAGLQARIEALAAETVAPRGDRLQMAVLVADHASGQVLAQVGSAAYAADARLGFVDMTLAPRSPGSTLKPLIYALAFDQGLAHPETLVEDRPTRFGDYAPQNFDRVYRGTIRLRQALQLSLNIPAVALTEAMGPAHLLAALRRAGADPQLPAAHDPGLAIALGGLGLTLEELVQTYAAIARGGVVLPLHATGGAVQGQRLISAPAAWQVADILTGTPPPAGLRAGGIAFKTGTSYGHRDAWAIGFDGRHVAGVWLGRADGTPVPGAFGADLAAPVLFQVFQRIKPRPDPLPPPPPATLIAATAQLPPPLQRFRPRGAEAMPLDAPRIAFPPEGATLDPLAEGVPLRLTGGQAPFTVLADGLPLATGLMRREVLLPLPGPGFVTLSVIDAGGRSARVAVRLAQQP